MLRPLLSLLLGFTMLLGVALPHGFTSLAQAMFPRQANGSLVERDGTVVGSALIGQDFAGERWFQPRPSATSEADPENEGKTRARPYNAAASTASQNGPTSAALLEAVRGRVGERRGVAADAATASASGLDPHVSPGNARAQVARVAAARGMPEARVATLLAQHVEGRELGFLGEPRVNVLRLNLALDRLR